MLIEASCTIKLNITVALVDSKHFSFFICAQQNLRSATAALKVTFCEYDHGYFFNLFLSKSPVSLDNKITRSGIISDWMFSRFRRSVLFVGKMTRKLTHQIFTKLNGQVERGSSLVVIQIQVFLPPTDNFTHVFALILTSHCRAR